MTLEAKIKVAARLFYQDNRDQYESYDQAVKEMRAHCSEAFIDAVARGTAQPRPGHFVLYRESDGHVVAVRREDNYLTPVTQMTLDEGAKLEADYHKVRMANLDVRSVIVLLQKMDWAIV